MTCPLCDAPLKTQAGSQINPDDGVTLYCGNKECPAQEVFGHGPNEASAYFVIQEKYQRVLDVK